MSNYLMYHDNSCETGRELARALGIESGSHLPERRFDSVIRWGNRERVRYTPTRTLNKLEAMNNASNKERAFTVMDEFHVPHPPIVNSFNGKLLLGRPSSHQHGSGAYFITSSFDMDLARRVGCTHFMEFISIKREFRVHVFGDEAIFSYERVCPSNPKSLNIRNDWNETRVEIRDLPNNIKTTAISAVRAMGLDFGAVDIGLSVNGNVFIFEVNTAPALINEHGHLPSFNVYINNMREWLNDR